MGTLIILLVVAVAYGQEYRSCPFGDCVGYLNDIEDYDTCLHTVEEGEQCIQDALKKADTNIICETCETWDFDGYTRKDFGADLKKAYCKRKQCDMETIEGCFRPAERLIMFYDTSVIDQVISCIDGWNPAPGRAQCLNEMASLDLPGYIDPIEAIKQVLTEVKAGCDPILSVVICREELSPLAPFMGLRNGNETLDDATKAIEGMFTCVQKKLKNYPCKTLSTILAGGQNSLVNTIKNWYGVRQNAPGTEVSVKDKYCQKSQGGNPKFARFAEFFHQKK